MSGSWFCRLRETHSNVVIALIGVNVHRITPIREESTHYVRWEDPLNPIAALPFERRVMETTIDRSGPLKGLLGRVVGECNHKDS
jgi:hypothetical protein